MLPGNGKVEHAEFEDTMANEMDEVVCKNDWKPLFNPFDLNGDGFITRDELALSLASFITKEEIDALFTRVDRDHDGKLNCEGTAMRF